MPLDVVAELVSEGRIGELHDVFYTTTGNGTPVTTSVKFGQEIAAELNKADLGVGVTWKLKGEDEEREKAGAFLMGAFGTAIFLIFVASSLPIMVAVMSAVHHIPVVNLRAGRNFGLKGLRLMRHVIYPAIMPRLLVGLRLALGISWIVVVAAEMISVRSGLGFLIIDSRNAGNRYDLIIAGMVMIGAIGVMLDLGMRQLEKLKSVRWGYQSSGRIERVRRAVVLRGFHGLRRVPGRQPGQR